MRSALALAVLLAALVACGDDEDERSSATTSAPATSVTTATTQSTAESDCARRPSGSSAATFDPAQGTYAAQGVLFDAPSIEFDVVQWLSGEDARGAWLRDHPEEPDGPPNDYYIVDESDRVRTATVSGDAAVQLTHLRSDGTASVEPDSLDALAAYLDGGHPTDTYWLTFDGGVVTEICEQYRP